MKIKFCLRAVIHLAVLSRFFFLQTCLGGDEKRSKNGCRQHRRISGFDGRQPSMSTRKIKKIKMYSDKLKFFIFLEILSF